MKIERFTEDAEVLRILHSMREQGIDERTFSDVIDAAGHQYVDLVQEGGGVLGIALTGYVYVLEQMGIRFLQLAGASAGAINTMLMAAAGPINEEKTTWILQQLIEQDLSYFIDGDSDAREFIDALMSDASNLKIALKGAQVVDNFRDDFGLNPGKNFKNWIQNLLAQRNIHTLAELKALRKNVPVGFRKRGGPPLGCEEFERIALVSADITTETKVEFPRMAELYWSDPDHVNPSEFVRASMSIPIFFHPYRIKGIPQGAAQWELWNKLSGYAGNIPTEVLLVDGGIMSNFPIDLFHNKFEIPKAPTFGVKLGYDRRQPNKHDKFFGFIGATFDAARHVHDYDFLMQNPDYRHLLCHIETGSHNWLNFELTETERVDLFIRGAKAAGDFLTKFDWEKYKKLRGETAKVYKHDKALREVEAEALRKAKGK